MRLEGLVDGFVEFFIGAGGFCSVEVAAADYVDVGGGEIEGGG